MTILNNTRAKILLVALTSTSLYGCGFHLSGWKTTTPSFKQTIFIQYTGSDFQFLNALKTTITKAGATLATTPTAAKITINITNTQKLTQLIGITGGAYANDYILSFQTNYTVLDDKKTPLIINQIASAAGNYSTNATQQLSNNIEQQKIYNTLRLKVANQIVSNVQSIQTTYKNGLKLAKSKP